MPIENNKERTIVTLCFEGHEHQAAADDFIIQYADGGLNEHLEGMYENIDRYLNLDKEDFDTTKRTITLVMSDEPIE